MIMVEGAQPVGKNVHINVSCTLETLLNLPGAPGAEVEHGDPISSTALGRLACDATICKILLDDKLVPVAVGSMKRRLTRRERRALNARDRHCQWPECGRSPMWCDGHHVEYWSHGGPTELDNMLLLCKAHHWRVHEGGWKLSLGAKREVVVVPPPLFTRARGPGVLRR